MFEQDTIVFDLIIEWKLALTNLNVTSIQINTTLIYILSTVRR